MGFQLVSKSMILNAEFLVRHARAVEHASILFKSFTHHVEPPLEVICWW